MSGSAPASAPVSSTDTTVPIIAISSEFYIFTTKPVKSAILG
jgi:hypothetical protein